MKSKKLTLIFRILLMLTFIAGMIYLISFVRLAGAPAVMTPDEYLAACRRWTNVFFVYMAMTLASAVLSVMALRGANKLTGVLRTAVIVFAAVANILAVRYIAAFRGYEDAVEAAKAVDGLVDTGTVFIIMSFSGAMLLFFLMITSVYDIVTTFRTDEFEKLAEEQKNKKQK